MSLKEFWQQQRQQRQQELILRQQMVRQSLAAAEQARQVNAALLRDELSLFREAIATGDRTRRVEAAKLSLQLESFVQNLRQQTTENLTALAAERAIMALQVEKELTAFVEALRTDVQSYLWEMETIRQNRAVELNERLWQSRIARQAEVEAMFQRFSEFRAELKHFCDQLRSQVWGGDIVASPALSQEPIANDATKANGLQTEARPEAKSVAQLQSKPNAQALAVLTQPTSSAPVGAFQPGDSIAVAPAKSAKPEAKDSTTIEKDVYNFIHQTHGARLTQIEPALGINRFQAVNALRSLIKKGLISQRDRTYITIEDLQGAGVRG